jgi:hypothetical protein
MILSRIWGVVKRHCTGLSRRECDVMDKWTPRLKLLSVLATTKELLLRSETDGWPVESSVEATETVDGAISHVLDPRANPLPKFALIYYAPTGPIQEIAMANGWHDVYLVLSAEYDKLAYLIDAET